MNIISVDSGGAVVMDDSETIRHYIHADRINALLRSIQSPHQCCPSIQVTTGISADEQDLLDLQKAVHEAARRATKQAQAGWLA